MKKSRKDFIVFPLYKGLFVRRWFISYTHIQQGRWKMKPKPKLCKLVFKEGRGVSSPLKITQLSNRISRALPVRSTEKGLLMITLTSALRNLYKNTWARMSSQELQVLEARGYLVLMQQPWIWTKDSYDGVPEYMPPCDNSSFRN